VGPAGFEPTTFTQKPPENGSLRVSLVTLQNFVILHAGVSKPLLASGARPDAEKRFVFSESYLPVDTLLIRYFFLFLLFYRLYLLLPYGVLFLLSFLFICDYLA